MKQYTGKSLEEVLKNVSAEKNVDKEDLIYYIIEEKSGFLGIGSSVTAEVYAPSDVQAFIDTYVSNFFEGFGIRITVDTEVKNSNVRVFINSDNNAIIIGRNGNSLEGFNTLLKHSVNSEFKRRFYVFVDVNNYKNDRYQKLKAMAKRVAQSVQRTKISADLDPMPNDERRIIHKELTDFPNIKTQSEGSGRNRHLRIIYVEGKE